MTTTSTSSGTISASTTDSSSTATAGSTSAGSPATNSTSTNNSSGITSGSRDSGSSGSSDSSAERQPDRTIAPAAAGFHDALAAPARAAAIPKEADVYGWLVGSWRLDVLHYRGVDLRGRGMTGEVHFGRVLEGRAIQDVWIMPARADRSAADDPGFDMYGMTLRVWDPAIAAWRITWVNPIVGHREEQIGRWRGRDIVQIGARADGTPTRWTYTDITPDSFHWLGEALGPDGETWRLEGEFLGTRLA